jgi:hypothetical protein
VATLGVGWQALQVVDSQCPRATESGLKIRVSVAQFHPWPHQIFYFPNACNQAVPQKSARCAVFVP